MSADEIIRILDALGERLGPAGTHLLELAIRSQILGGIVSILVAIMIETITIFMTKQARTHGPDAAFPWAVFVIGTSFALVFFIGGLFGLLNPEYEAIKDLIDTIRGT